MTSVFDENVILLDKMARLNNYCKPNPGYTIKSEYVSATEFPEQDSDALLTNISIKYRDRTCALIDEPGMSEYYTRETNITILRWDITAPYIFIGCNNEGKLFVGDTREFPNDILMYCEQQYKFYKIETIDLFNDMRNQLNGIIIRCDDAQPSYCIIMEFVNDNTVRFILSDETVAKLHDDYKDKKEKDATIRESDIKSYLEEILSRYNLYGKNS